MSYKLLIRLRNETGPILPSDCLLLKGGGNHQIISSMEELPALAEKASEIIALVPSISVLLTESHLPMISYTKLMKALPFELENRLAEDPALLHFAIGERRKGETLSVAVVSKEKMAVWLKLLSQTVKGAQITVMFPDVLALPLRPHDITIFMDDLAIVRTAKHCGFSIEKEQLYSILKLRLKRMRDKPTLIKIFCQNKETILTPEQITSFGIPIETADAPKNPLGLMAESINNHAPINLLQAAYAPKQKKLTTEQWIGIGAVILAVWFLILTIVDFLNYLILVREKRALDHEVQLIYASIYPNEALPENPQAKVQKELKTLRNTRAESGFMRLLRAVNSQIASFSGNLNLKSLSYRNNQLLLEIETKDLKPLDSLRQALEAQGLKVAVSHAERSAGGLIETRLTVEEVS